MFALSHPGAIQSRRCRRRSTMSLTVVSLCRRVPAESSPRRGSGDRRVYNLVASLPYMFVELLVVCHVEKLDVRGVGSQSFNPQTLHACFRLLPRLGGQELGGEVKNNLDVLRTKVFLKNNLHDSLTSKLITFKTSERMFNYLLSEAGCSNWECSALKLAKVQ